MDFSDWIGNSVTSDDVITARMVDHFRHTLGAPLFHAGTEVPAGLHWCLAPEAVESGSCWGLTAIQSAAIFCLKFLCAAYVGRGLVGISW